jgi:hypothetical protein
MSLIQNERTKLTASALNTAATSSFIVGVLAPVAAAFYSFGTVRIPVLTIALGVCVWLMTAVALHLGARRVLKGLKA